MELNAAHKAQASKFVAFFRGKRERILADKEAGRDEFKSDRLADDEKVYNKSDVEALLDAYASQVIGAFGEELETLATNAADFCTQLLNEAEQKEVTLDGADISLVDDPSRAAKVLALAAGGGLGPAPGAKKTLGAIEGTVSDPTALAAVQEAKEEVRQRDDTIMSLQTQMTGIKEERSRIQGELEVVKANFKKLRTSGGGGGDSGANLALQSALEAKTKELEDVQKDMQKKLAESSQFKDLKSMMQKKSDEVKELRRAMQQAGLPLPGDKDEGIELEADSD